MDFNIATNKGKSNNPFAGVLIGLILLVVGTVLLWWNEGNNVKNIKTVDEISKNVIDISSTSVQSEYNGKLVATNGRLNVEEEVYDDVFTVGTKTPILKRTVEIYEWEETAKTDDDDNTTYEYKKVWKEELIASSAFQNSGYNNPTIMPYSSQGYIASSVKVGAYRLSSEQISNLATEQNIDVQVANLPSGYTTNGSYVTNSSDLSNPQIGDIRISWQYNNWTEVSVLAKLYGDTFTDYISSKGKHVNRVEKGILTSEEIINKIQDENKALKWGLRAAGVVALIVGYLGILSPISKLTSFVPILGKIVGGAFTLVGSLAGIVHSLLVIAIAWIRFRPVLGICLLIACAILMYIIRNIINKSKQPEENIERRETYGK